MGAEIHRKTVAEINEVHLWATAGIILSALNALLGGGRVAFTVARQTLSKVRTGNGHSNTRSHVRANSERAGSFHTPGKFVAPHKKSSSFKI
jgi:hypothetical protein